MQDLTAGHAVVSTPHPQAAAAALEVLKSGGNAVDAAVAGMMTLCVVMPYNVSLGGYGGAMIVHLAKSNRTVCIDFDARAPKAFKPELYTKPATTEYGYLALATPGVVAGLDMALRTLGTRQWRGVSQHALQLAEEGFTVQQGLSNTLKTFFQHADKTSIHAVFPDGQPPAIGGRWIQKDLAKVISQLNDDPSSFYHGDIPHQIAQQVLTHGGILAEDDFSSYQARAIEPLHVNYRGHDVFTPPPPAGGITSLTILKTLEQFEIGKLDPWSAPYFDLFVAATRLGWQDRARYFGDPHFVQIPMEQLLSTKAAQDRANRIRKGDVSTTQPAMSTSPHTCNIVTIDQDRNLVSLTATQGNTFGACVAIEGLGLFLGHGMIRFDYRDRTSPNAPAPLKRMQHNMSPAVILKDGKPYASIGLPGGTRIVTVTAELAQSLIDFHATPAQAITAPRVHTDGPDPLLCSATLPRQTAAELELMGHKLRLNQSIGGPANVAVIDTSTNKISVASEAGPSAVATW